MNRSVKKYNIYTNLGYWFAIFVLLVILGFYHSYLSSLHNYSFVPVHIHFILMAIWILMLIVQPFLIKCKKLSIHRVIGKLSYVIVPLTLISTFLMMRYGYANAVSSLTTLTINGIAKYSNNQVKHIAANNMALPFLYFMWMAVFYGLAISKIHQPAKHARYMVATALTILGPTVDRMWYPIFKIEIFPLNIPLETFAYLLIDIILMTLLWHDYMIKKNLLPLSVCICIYVSGQVFYFTGRDSIWWERFITLILD